MNDDAATGQRPAANCERGKQKILDLFAPPSSRASRSRPKVGSEQARSTSAEPGAPWSVGDLCSASALECRRRSCRAAGRRPSASLPGHDSGRAAQLSWSDAVDTGRNGPTWLDKPPASAAAQVVEPKSSTAAPSEAAMSARATRPSCRAPDELGWLIPQAVSSQISVGRSAGLAQRPHWSSCCKPARQATRLVRPE